MGFPEGTPTVTVELGGKPRQLGFTMAAMRRCDELGVLDMHTADAEGKVKPTTMMLAVPKYVWACMDAEGRAELSLEDVEELINPLTFHAIEGKIVELLALSRPPDTEGNAEPAAGAKKPTAGAREPLTSKHSGQRESTTSA